eukprot:5793325-Pleurochrysis_carterae.AAC.1
MLDALQLPFSAEVVAAVTIGALASAIILFKLANRVFSTNPKIPFVPKPYGVVDSNGVMWNAATAGEFLSIKKAPTVYELVKQAVEKFADCPAMGARALLERHYEMVHGKEVEKLTFADEFSWISFRELGSAFHNLGAGMVSFAGLKAGDSVVIYAETQREWMIACLAAFSQSLVVVTVYATLGGEGLAHGVKQTKAKLIIADAKLLPKVAAAVRQYGKQMSKCTHVISIPDPVQTADSKNEAVGKTARQELSQAGWASMTFQEAQAKGAASSLSPVPPKPDDTAVIMYTSGTTGLPKLRSWALPRCVKFVTYMTRGEVAPHSPSFLFPFAQGVVIAHKSIVACSEGLEDRMKTFSGDIVDKGPEH